MPEALTPFKTRIPKPVKSSTDTSKSTSSASRSTKTANSTSTTTPNSTSTSNFQYERYNYNQCNQYNRYRQTPPRPPLNSKNRNIYCQLGDLEPPPSPFTQITTVINNRLKTPPPRPTNKSTEQLSYTFFSLVRTPRGQAPLTLAPAKPKPSVYNCTSNTSNTLSSPSEQRRVVSVRGVEYDIAPVFYLGGRKGSFESNSSRSRTRQLPPKPPIVTKVASQPIYPWELRPTTATHFNSQTPPPIYQSMPAIYDTLQSNRPMSVAPSSFAAPTPTPQRNFQTPLPIMPLSEPVQTPPPPPPPPTPTPFHAQCRAAQCETPPPPQQIAVPVPVPVPVGVPVPVSVPVGVPVPVPVPVHCCSDQSNNECRPRLGKVKIRKQKRRKNKMVDAFMGPPLVIPGYMAFVENLERCQQANNDCLAQTCF